MLLRRPLLPGGCSKLSAQSWKRRPRITISSHRRHLHKVPPLNHDKHWSENGLGSLLDPLSYKMAWHDYQGLMVGKLNELTVGRPDENKTARQLLLAHARNPLEAALFNHASMAFNNNFFFESLVGQKPRSPSGTEIPQPLADSLASSFGSLATLRDELIDTADAMFGPGFVWLVQTPDMRFRLLATYLAGSPFKEAHTRLQAVDMNTQSVGSVGGLTDADVRRQTEAQNSPGSFGNFADGAANRPGGLSVTPVLCVNTWEHVWVGLYGVQGKRLYLERWWSNVDWHVVQTRCQLRSGRNDGLMTK